MKIPRRRFLSLAIGAVGLPAVSRIATAQAYPAKPVHIIAGYPPGGVVRIYARLTDSGSRSGSASYSLSRIGQALVAQLPWTPWFVLHQTAIRFC